MSSTNKQKLVENVENYRKVIKHLKGKCQTFEKLNQYLTSQILNLETDSPAPFKNFLLYNDCFSHFISSGKEKIGDIFSLEMVYRMLDRNYEGRISSDALSEFLQKTLNLSPAQTTRIVLVFDENCNGFITKDTYFKVLDSFQCRSEMDHLADSSTPKKFSIDDLIKQFAEKMMYVKMTPLQFFNMAIKSRKEANYMTYEEFETLWKGNLFQMKELDLKELNVFVVIFDQNFKGHFTKFTFIENLNKLFKRILGFASSNRRYLDSCYKELSIVSEEKLKEEQKKREENLNFGEEDENLEEGDQGMAPTFNSRSPIEIPSKNEQSKQKTKIMENKNSNENEKDSIFDQDDKLKGDQLVGFQKESPKKPIVQQETKKKNDLELSGQEILINAAQKSGKHLYLCFEAILEDSLEPHLGFTVNDIFSKLDYYYGAYLNKKAKIDILKSIDLNGNGVYDFFELKAFFLESCQGKISVKTLLLVFAKELQSKQMKTKELFTLNNLDLNMKMNLKQFVEETKPILNLDFSDISAIFLEICDSDAEVCLNDFIIIIDSLRNDSTMIEDSKAIKTMSKQEVYECGLQVKKNNKIRSVIASFNMALKDKKITGKDLLKRTNASNNDKTKQNIIFLSKLQEVLKRILSDKKPGEISEFLDILDEKKTGMITLDDFERIVNFEGDHIEIKPLGQSEKEEIRESLNEFLEKKQINMHQFFDLIDREGKGVVDLIGIKEGLLSQGFAYSN